MSSLASLISSVKSNTANNAHVNRTLKRKATVSKEELKQQRKKALLEKKEASQNNKPSGPNVVVFDGSVLEKKPVLEDKASKKRFLDSRITGPEDSETTEQKNKPTKKEEEEDAENHKHDLELKELLSSTNILEELEFEQMSSREKRKTNMKKLEDLGAKAAPGQKMPLYMKLSLDKAKKEKDMKKLQEAKDLGIYDKSLKHLYVKTKAKKRDRDPGITNGVGRMKGATLTINKADIERIKRQGSKKKSSGKKK